MVSITLLCHVKFLLVVSCLCCRTSSKLLCYTRAASLTSRLFPEEYHQNSAEYKAVLSDHVYDSKFLTVYQFSERLSQRHLEKSLSDFFKSHDEKKVFLFIVGIQESTKKNQMYNIINHVRIIMEQVENEHPSSDGKKILVMLLLFPPRSFINACYPCNFLEGWEHYYLDSLSQAGHEGSAVCINTRDWFRQFCLRDDEPSHIQSFQIFLRSFLDEALPALVSRLQFRYEKGIFYKGMEVYDRRRMLKVLLEEKGIGDILIERFQSCWNLEIISQYILMAAQHTFNYDSTLNLADQIQVQVCFLFTEFLVYMVHVMSRNGGLHLFFSSESSSIVPLYKKLLGCITIPKLEDFSELKYHDIISIDIKNQKYLKPHMFPCFLDVHDMIASLINTCRSRLIEQSEMRSDDFFDKIYDEVAKEWKSISVSELLAKYVYNNNS